MNNDLGFIPGDYPEGQISLLLAPNYHPKNGLISADNVGYFGGLFLIFLPFFSLFFNIGLIFAIATVIFYLAVWGSLLAFGLLSALRSWSLNLNLLAFKMVLEEIQINGKQNSRQSFKLAHSV